MTRIPTMPTPCSGCSTPAACEENGKCLVPASPGSIRETFIVRDSGERQGFDTGAVRDTQDGKPRYDLISTWAKKRLAIHLGKGAEKYGERNWEKGIPASRCLASAQRHLELYEQGDTVEDHLSAAAFNVLAILHFDELGRTDLLDVCPIQPAE